MNHLNDCSICGGVLAVPGAARTRLLLMFLRARRDVVGRNGRVLTDLKVLI